MVKVESIEFKNEKEASCWTASIDEVIFTFGRKTHTTVSKVLVITK